LGIGIRIIVLAFPRQARAIAGASVNSENATSFRAWAEIILTTEGSQHEPVVRAHTWVYDLSMEDEPTPLRVRVLPGCSPVRQALRTRGEFPEQSLRA